MSSAATGGRHDDEARPAAGRHVPRDGIRRRSRSTVARRCSRQARPGAQGEVVAYLRKGKAFSFSPGPLRDYFDDTKYVGSHTMRTDGTFLWPDFVAGYVERHDVELPPEFERHMEAAGWRLPEVIDIATLQHPKRPT